MRRIFVAACLGGVLSSAANPAIAADDQPAGEWRASDRRYRPDTLVLETEFETAEGVVRIVDFMPPRRHEPDLGRAPAGGGGDPAAVRVNCQSPSAQSSVLSGQ